MGFSLRPNARYGNIFELDATTLKHRGITLLLADLDNTLIPYEEKMPDARIKAWAKSLEAGGVTLFILSNSRKPTRARAFAEALGVPFLGHAGKPGRAGFDEAMARMGCAPAQTAMVGDQIFTDILGANHAGVLSLLVKPIRFGTPFRALRYALETPFRLSASREEIDVSTRSGK